MFEDREEAGSKLAREVEHYKNNVIILALPRGGVPVGFEIAKKLRAPLDVIVARKLGAPHNPELGIGAISEGGSTILDESSVARYAITVDQIKSIKDKEFSEIKRRIELYRGGKSLPELKNKVVILVDDGVATGVTARAAIAAIKKQNPKKLIFASPVCSYESYEAIKPLVDGMVCTITPHDLVAIGSYYRNFSQVTDEEVIAFLRKSKIE